MLHDIRNTDPNFFPKRYNLPYFYSLKEFNFFLDKLLPVSYDSKSNEGYVYTFDDGLIDHLQVAKILYQKKIKAIFFIPSEPVVNRMILNAHKIQFIISSNNEGKIVKEIENIIRENFIISDKELNQYRISRWEKNIWSKEMVFITRILREFKGQFERNFLLNKLFSKFVSNDQLDFASNFYLNEINVKEIADMGHLIGGHGSKSNDLRFSTKKEIISEINQSLEFVKIFEKEKFYYAYAHGGYNKEIVDLISKTQFKKAFTTTQNEEKNYDEYKIKRFEPRDLI